MELHIVLAGVAVLCYFVGVLVNWRNTLMDPNSTVNTGSEDQLQAVITELSQAVADAHTREINQSAAFTQVITSWQAYATDIKAKMDAAVQAEQVSPQVHEDHTQDIQKLLASLEAVKTLGLSELPTALVQPPTNGNPPASEPPLVAPTDPSQVQVTPGQGVTILPKPVPDSQPGTQDLSGQQSPVLPLIDTTGTVDPSKTGVGAVGDGSGSGV